MANCDDLPMMGFYLMVDFVYIDDRTWACGTAGSPPRGSPCQ